jgi:hypothetical protein
MKKPCNCASNKVCKAGYIKKGYIRKDGTKVKGSLVKPVCIKDLGKTGKGPKTLPPIPKKDVGMLSELGYKLKESAEKRDKSLKKAVKKYGKEKVVKKLNYVRILSKSNKTKFNKLTKDMYKVQKMEIK